jgi:magnesium transporter
MTRLGGDFHMACRARSIIFLTSLGLLGCSQELGPERFPTARVRGTVRIGDRPLIGGFVAFDPAEGTRGNVRVTPIRSDGSFEADGVSVGRVIVRIDQIPGEDIATVSGRLAVPIVERMLFASPIRRTIPEGRESSLPIDLIEEANRVIRGPRKSRRRRTRSTKTLQAPPAASPQKDCQPDTESSVPVPQVRVVYREGSGTVHLDWPFAEIERAIGDPQGTVWVDIQDLESACNDGVEALLRDVFQFHPLAIEDALKDTHVPKVDDWDKYLYIVVDTLDFDPESDEIRLHELDLFLGDNYLVTYHNEATEVLERHRRNLEREPESRLKFGPSHLLYRLLDEVVAEFLPAIEHLDNLIDDAQDEVFAVPTPRTLRKIFHVKRNALKLHRVVIPMREVLNRLARDPYGQVAADHRIYFRDVYDHLVRIHDIVESLRDLIAGALDTYLSVVSNRTNDIMKALTVVNVMFLPLTFLVGFFGMNFFGDTLMFVSPPLPKAALFWLACAIMVGTPVAMTIMARRRGWF